MGIPHDAQAFANTAFHGGFNPAQFAQGIGPGPAQMNMNPQMQMAQHLQAQGMTPAQRQYQMHMQAQARLQAQQTRTMNGVGMPNPQMNAMQQPGGMPSKPNPPEELFRQLQSFMAARGRAVDPNPLICSRPVPLMRLYGVVLKCGGSSKVTKMNQWPFVAQNLGFPQMQFGQAAQELQNYWMANLAPFESAWIAATQQKNQMRMAAQANVQNQIQNQMLPNRIGFQGEAPMNHGHQRSQSDLMAIKTNAQMLNNTQQHNSFMPAQQVKEGQDSATNSQHRRSLSRQFDPSHLNGMQSGPGPMPSPQKRPPSSSAQTFVSQPEPTMPVKKPIEDPFQPVTLEPSLFHGPINTEEMSALGQSLVDVKPVNPHARELGVIDIHALTMAIKSGMHAETRLALDTLVTVSMEHAAQLALPQCDDLLETLVDCAQEQADFLLEHAAEVSDEMLLTSYEDLIRLCKVDAQSLQDISEFGSLAYDLDRAADRIVCITTLFRNFSFYEPNFGPLGTPEVMKLLTNIIRNLGTKENFLRSNRNTVDFMKDIVTYLSNSSQTIQLPGKEEALCLLHFLLAFAPTPLPVSAASAKVTFTMYNPNVHKYLPSAVDSLAKLLARDEPNRTFFKSIFISDGHSSPAFELITRTFGLAIAPLPINRALVKSVIETRKPFLLQGLLAAEILAGLAPNSDHTLARSWLESEEGFAPHLLHFVSITSTADRSSHNGPRPPQQQGRNAAEQDANAYVALGSRAVAILKVLVQKSRTTNADGAVQFPLGVFLKKETLLGAMVNKDVDQSILRQLCIYAGLEE